MRPLSPEEELQYLREIYGADKTERLFALLTDSFNTLHARAQLLLSLITICLTITGFSGPKIADSGLGARLLIAVGLTFVLLSALFLLLGPLRVRWVTRYRAETLDQTLIELLRRRNRRTRIYLQAMFLLLIGLSAYVASVVCYLLHG